jgi:hypothetical protein
MAKDKRDLHYYVQTANNGQEEGIFPNTGWSIKQLQAHLERTHRKTGWKKIVVSINPIGWSDRTWLK